MMVHGVCRVADEVDGMCGAARSACRDSSMLLDCRDRVRLQTEIVPVDPAVRLLSGDLSATTTADQVRTVEPVESAAAVESARIRMAAQIQDIVGMDEDGRPRPGRHQHLMVVGQRFERRPERLGVQSEGATPHPRASLRPLVMDWRIFRKRDLR